MEFNYFITKNKTTTQCIPIENNDYHEPDLDNPNSGKKMVDLVLKPHWR